MKAVKNQCVCLMVVLAMFLLSSISEAATPTTNLFGPTVVERKTTAPVSATFTFQVPTAGTGTLLINNGPKTNTTAPVSSAYVYLNGKLLYRMFRP